MVVILSPLGTRCHVIPRYMPKRKIFLSRAYEWKACLEEEPTASSTSGKGMRENKEMKAGAKRNRSQRRRLSEMRNPVATEWEAATGCSGVGPGWVGLGWVGLGSDGVGYGGVGLRCGGGLGGGGGWGGWGLEGWPGLGCPGL